MNSFRVAFFAALGCVLIFSLPLIAEDSASFAFAKQYSADLVGKSNDGRITYDKISMDNGKLRLEMDVAGANGSTHVTVIRPDLQKIYVYVVEVMKMRDDPADLEKCHKAMGPFWPDAKFETTGSEAIDGVACTKYKITSANGKTSQLWIDAAKQVPVKM